jgi:hypothetical protein
MDPSLAHLLGRLSVIEVRVRAAVARRRARDPHPDDRFRGLYISDRQIDQLLTARPDEPSDEAAIRLAEVEASADDAEAQGADLRLRRLIRSFDLMGLDVELLLIALAPDLDRRLERLYGYLHDDVTRRRASTGLALELSGMHPVAASARGRFGSHGPLVAGSLLLIEDPSRPFLTRSLRVPDRVIAHLLGDDTLDPLATTVVTEHTGCALGDTSPIERAMVYGTHLCYVRQRPGAAARSFASTALSRAGFPAISIDFLRWPANVAAEDLAAVLMREARLLGRALLAGPIELLAERGISSVRAFADGTSRVVLFGSVSWDPIWSARIPFVLDAPQLDQPTSTTAWQMGLNGQAHLASSKAMSSFRLAPEQIVRASQSALLQAQSLGRPLHVDDLLGGARAQNAAGLERLARRVEPEVGWDDLVAPKDVLVSLKEIASRARLSDRVMTDWAMRRGSRRGSGITALFAGEPGTGKTMAAEVVARELKLDLYLIDLSTVVDKYVGETEKNLDRIFLEAEQVNGVILFDEADALFGKRSEVKDAHDRYANIEVGYLLQRMESFDGLAILATNLRANLDQAFARRLDVVVDFPFPDDAARLLLWRKVFSPLVPGSTELDLDFLSAAFRISGGNIRNVAVAACFYAAESQEPVRMVHVIRGIQQEYQKLGRLCLEAEFGEYHHLLATHIAGA